MTSAGNLAGVVESDGADFVARVPAKINIALAIGALRSDGFHELATVYHAVSLWDEITASVADGFEIEVVGPHIAGVPADETNLALRAARLLAERAGVAEGVRLRVHKDIPVAGGLAGGSADAAGALLACSRLWNVSMPVQALGDIAAEVGSDVPFAVRGGTAVGEGRGERLRVLDVPAAPLHWVLVTAREGLSTPEVYKRFDTLSGRQGPVYGARLPAETLDAVRGGDAGAVARVMHNDLQPAAIDAQPGLATTLQAGADAGALAGIVSGSGPTCAFLARDADHAGALAGGLQRSGVGERVLPVSGPVAAEVEPCGLT